MFRKQNWHSISWLQRWCCLSTQKTYNDYLHECFEMIYQIGFTIVWHSMFHIRDDRNWRTSFHGPWSVPRSSWINISRIHHVEPVGELEKQRNSVAIIAVAYTNVLQAIYSTYTIVKLTVWNDQTRWYILTSSNESKINAAVDCVCSRPCVGHVWGRRIRPQ